MSRNRNTVLQSTFLRNVGKLVGGTAIAQLLMLLALPILTRLYSPEDFTVLAVFAAIVGIIAVPACLRFEVAIPIPVRDEDAADLLFLALFSCATVAAFSGIALFLYEGRAVAVLGQPALQGYLWLMPLGVWLSGSYAALQYWATRRKRFGSIAYTRMTQSVGGTGLQILAGYAGLAPLGLLVGQIFTSGAGVFSLAVNARCRDRRTFGSMHLSRIMKTAKEYSRFPTHSTVEALANTMAIQVPVLIIAAAAIGPEAGFFVLAMRVMRAPMSLIGAAVGQVFLSKAPEEYREGRLPRFTVTILLGLLRTGAGPILFAGIISPVAFPYVFGAEWTRAGDIVFWVTPWVTLQFLSAPLAMSLQITHHHRTALLLHVGGLIGRATAVWLAASVAVSFVIEVYALSSFIFYCVYLFVVLVRSDVTHRDFGRNLYSAVIPVCVWVISGVLVRYVVKV